MARPSKRSFRLIKGGAKERIPPPPTMPGNCPVCGEPLGLVGPDCVPVVASLKPMRHEWLHHGCIGVVSEG